MINFKNLSKKEKIIEYSFLTWFVVSIILFIIPINPHFTVFIFGQYFFVFGLLILYLNGIKIGIVPYLVSIGVFIFLFKDISIINYNYFNAVMSEYNIFIPKILLFIVPLILLLLGFLFLVIFHFKKDKKIFFVIFTLFNIISILLMFLF